MQRIFDTDSKSSLRWGWLALAAGLMAAAGFFLYPSLESFTTRREIAHRATVDVQEPALPPAMPVERPAPAAPAPKPAPRKVTPPKPASAILAGKPVRQFAPSAPEGIRNRISGEVRVEVRLHVGKNGKVTGAKLLTSSRDGVQSFLGQRALEAVRQWKFQPGKTQGDRTVRFRFRKSGTQWTIMT